VDIRNLHEYKDYLSDIDVVIHLACISNDPSFELNPKLGKSINFDCFEPLVEESMKNKIKKFIYASSSSVYGLKKEKNVIESMSLEPLTEYSYYKGECEKILNNYASKEFCTTTVRPATVCGYSPRQRLDLVVNILTNFAYNKNKIRIMGGDQLRPNINIKDMVNSYIHLINANSDLINSEIFNVGFENHSVKELGLNIKELMNKNVELIYEQTEDNRSYHISSEKIKEKLKFEYKYTINDAIKDLIFAFESKSLTDTFNNPDFFNIKKMQKINLV
jgi:nucleoside-diphosphate-sugar epimerase